MRKNPGIFFCFKYMKQNETILSPKNADILVCKLCDFKCYKLSNYNLHLSTRKHKMKQNETPLVPKNAEKPLCCKECGKPFNSRTSLWRHKQKCITPNMTLIKSEDLDYKTLFYRAMDEMKEQRHDFIEQLHIQHDELRKKDEIMEQMIDKVGTTNNITNTMNNHFNINMFLNETCKNAMNFSDFIDRIEVSHDDLENNAQLGFVNGITKILMDNLKQLTIHERPIHCTDLKRETLYIKDQDVWEKENSTAKLSSAIQEVSRKSVLTLSQWKKTNPDYRDMDSEFSKKCIPMQQNSMGICNKSAFYPKIIHNLAKENSIAHLKI